MNNIALALRGPLLVLLTSGLGIHYVVSNVISLLVADARPLRAGRRLDLGEGGPAGRRGRAGPYSYDIHGIVSVSSEVRLPELERFRVGGLIGEPDIRVRLGRVSANGNGRVGSAIRYSEGPGGLGFGLDDPCGPSRSRPRPRRSCGRSPHVLYTNVVEPILRWTFAERGYALVHAACLADRGRAFLLTARTDTGKTTTILKILDSTPYSFLSDDLTLVTPEGRVLTYPKPLTISRHTLRAVKTPLLSRRERMGLVFQSRLHSRSGGGSPSCWPRRTCRRRRSTRSSSCSCRRRSSTWSGWCRTWTWRSRRGSRAWS